MKTKSSVDRKKARATALKSKQARFAVLCSLSLSLSLSPTALINSSKLARPSAVVTGKMDRKRKVSPKLETRSERQSQKSMVFAVRTLFTMPLFAARFDARGVVLRRHAQNNIVKCFRSEKREFALENEAERDAIFSRSDRRRQKKASLLLLAFLSLSLALSQPQPRPPPLPFRSPTSTTRTSGASTTALATR